MRNTGENLSEVLVLGIRLMWDEVPTHVLPFDPEKKLVFATGPLTGTEAPTAARTLVVSKSPQVYPKPLSTQSALV